MKKPGKRKRADGAEQEKTEVFMFGKKTKGNYVWGMVLFLTVSMLLSGCQKKPQETEETSNENIVVGFSQVGAESDWRVANTESMLSTFSEENGYELLYDDAKQKQENQIAAIRNFILQGVDYIVVAPIIESGWDAVLQEAKDAGIPVIVVDRMIDTDEELFTAWVGSNTYWEGETAAHWLAEYLQEQGRDQEEISILHVMGTLGATPQIGRSSGLEAGARKNSNWKIIAQVEGEFTQAKGYEVVAEVLKTNQDIDVVYCENDNSAFGAIEALEEAGIPCGKEEGVIIISFDATRAGLTACLEGQISLNVECNPLHGPRVEKIIQQIEAGQTPEKMYYVEETYFQAEDLTAEFIEERAY